MEKEQKYVFISYSHRDTDIVLPIIEKLQERYDVWYDKGIKHGSEFNKFIAEKILNCSLFLYFITNNSLASDYCQDEIHFARTKKIPFVNAIMEEVDLPSSFEMRYGRFQMCHRSNYRSMDDFIDALDDDMASAVDAASISKEMSLTDFVIEGTVLKGYKGDCEKVAIPDSVTEIGHRAFEYNETLKTIIIPYSVTSIDSCAFIGCENLANVTIGNGVTSIGDSAFAECVSLKTIKIPDSVVSIDNAAFCGCAKLKSVTMGEKVSSIGDDAFSGCSKLASIELPDDLASIGKCAFENCSSLRDIDIPESVASLGAGAFMGCSSLRSIGLFEGITEIGDSTFEGCSSLESVVIPKTVVSLGSTSFARCSSLESVILPRGVVSVGYAAFSGCESLKTVSLPNTLSLIEDQVFFNCPSLELNQDGNALYMGNKVNPYLYLLKPIDEKVKECKVNGNCRFIASYAFSYCEQLKSVTLPEGLLSIDANAFEGCRLLKTLVLPNSIRSIRHDAFMGCELLRTRLYFNGTKDNWSCIDPEKVYGIGLDPYHKAPILLHCTDGDVEIV